MTDNAYKSPESSKPVKLTNQVVIKPIQDDIVDVAPFGEIRSWENGRDIGVLWEDSRDIFKVVVRFADASQAPDPSKVKLQYWRKNWPQQRIPRERIAGSGYSGWLDIGDWFVREWKDADTEVSVDGDAWTYTFRPINVPWPSSTPPDNIGAGEFPDLTDFPARYRTTLKLRLLFPEKAPQVASFHAFTDSRWKKTTAVVEWGCAADSEQVWDGKVEVFNGHVSGIRPIEGGRVRVNEDGSWTSRVKGTTDGVELDIWHTESPALHSFDGTVVTIRTSCHSFSFAASEIAQGRNIFIRDYGVLVKPANSRATWAEAEEIYQKGEKDFYRQVHDLPEQTLDRAWSDMPRKGRIYMPLACEGGRQNFGLQPNGDIMLSRNWTERIKSTDSPKAKWPGGNMFIRFGMSGPVTGASREEGDLPLAATWYERDGVRYDQYAFATPLRGSLPPEGRIPAEEPVALMLRFRLTNVTNKTRTAALPIQVETRPDDQPKTEPLALRDDLIFSALPEGNQLRMYVNANSAAKLTAKADRVLCEVELPAMGSKEFFITIPFLTELEPAQVAQLKGLDFEKQRAMIAGYWRKRQSEGCRIVTPEPMINDFYSAHASHLLINTENEVGGTGCMMAKVGTFGYGVYSNESVMMIVDLDRRGYHDIAEKALETFIRYQGTVPFPGDYSTTEGVFYGANGYQDGGYNQHHGWVMWGMAEHYWFTRDDKWLDRVAPNLVKACDWIIGQRNRTKTDERVGIRAIEHGLLPPGSLEDIGDWRSWMSNNVYSYWGLASVARALAERNHPEAKRLRKEAEDYRRDIRNAFLEAMVRSPVVHLRGWACIPSIPSEVHRRGRSFGWITETLEGSIHMLRCGLIEPHEQLAEWIMRDYEDNRYISDQFGYQISYLERDWFSLGGFSQQPNLLCGPTPYLERDEIKHYLRAYFNAFAAGYFPERAMITEHPLPNLGDYAGDHFKSSDEAMSASWLRWMFIWDEWDDLHLGKVLPRYWLADGREVKIENAHTHFGPMSVSVRSYAASGRIEMTIDPPTRTAPKAIYARFRHPDGRSMNRVTVNGKPWSNFDPVKEWAILPPLNEKTVVIAHYD